MMERLVFILIPNFLLSSISIKVNIWGFVSYNRWGIYRTNNSLNTAELVSILVGSDEEPGALARLTEDPNIEWFQQDNLKVHLTAAVTHEIDSANLKCLDWPSRSPDFNPIENLWILLKYKVGERIANSFLY